MTITNVALVGASGSLGPYILRALQSSSSLRTVVLLRQSSRSTFPDSIETKRIPNDINDHEALTEALRGQDALVLAYSGGLTEQSMAFIDAAVEAGVKRIIPADYGSCDSSDPKSLELVPLYKEKQKVRNYLTALQGHGDGQLSWTSLITGHFLDAGLLKPLLGFDMDSKTVTVFDGGQKMWSATPRDIIGYAVRRILELEDEPRLKNQLVYIQGVRTNQMTLIETVEKVTRDKLSIKHLDSEKYSKEKKQMMYKEDGSLDGEIVEELVCVEGIVNADWQDKPALVNDLLDIHTEDVEAAVRRVLQHE